MVPFGIRKSTFFWILVYLVCALDPDSKLKCQPHLSTVYHLSKSLDANCLQQLFQEVHWAEIITYIGCFEVARADQ